MHVFDIDNDVSEIIALDRLTRRISRKDYVINVDDLKMMAQLGDPPGYSVWRVDMAKRIDFTKLDQACEQYLRDTYLDRGLYTEAACALVTRQAWIDLLSYSLSAYDTRVAEAPSSSYTAVYTHLARTYWAGEAGALLAGCGVPMFSDALFYSLVNYGVDALESTYKTDRYTLYEDASLELLDESGDVITDNLFKTAKFRQMPVEAQYVWKIVALTLLVRINNSHNVDLRLYSRHRTLGGALWEAKQVKGVISQRSTESCYVEAGSEDI